ncbi:dGTP triphosphohydrolase [Thauera sp.]|jgi:dGTPase|uniref:dGTP triphosphohydrolase n=1 Tax=Thauera sp. TaxID=1905334 RepID=UPI00257D8A21|nr:dNTP triphosphohydrolase [Thauera sp.]
MASSTALNALLDLVTEDRLRNSTQGARGALIASESDKARVINSGAFRRLQQKAQVFPLEPNAAVRTRLTHSIEVSQIGRYLAQRVIQNFGSTSESYERLTAFVNNVETACLLHDIGNPPFGHLGESAVQEWFRDDKNNATVPDLCAFDGNPQGLRLTTFLSGADAHGLNLTCTLLLSTIKYPWDLDRRPEDKKIGIFSGDYVFYEQACAKLGWHAGRKFPFARLMDTADEIAYSMSDLEDGLEKKIISLDDLEKEFGSKRFPKGAIPPFIKFKTDVINAAVKVAADAFTTQLDNILAGDPFELVHEGSEIGGLLNQVNRFARARIYSNEAAEKVELAGRSVIKGLLRHFGELIKLSEESFSVLVEGDMKAIKKRNLDFQARLFRRLPTSYVEKYRLDARGNEMHRRSHLVVDFIAGMTDDFALETYQVLEGIKIK